MPRRGWSRLWRASMLSVASLGAAGAAAGGDLGGDARLPDAVQRRDTQAVQSLLAERADVNMRQGDGATALHWAAYLEDAVAGAGSENGRSVNCETRLMRPIVIVLRPPRIARLLLGVVQDVVFAARLFKRQPEIVGMTVVGLAVAIEVSTAALTLVNLNDAIRGATSR